MSLAAKIKDMRDRENRTSDLDRETDLLRAYNKMLESGLIKPRGYRLQTIDEYDRNVRVVSIAHKL